MQETPLFQLSASEGVQESGVDIPVALRKLNVSPDRSFQSSLQIRQLKLDYILIRKLEKLKSWICNHL